VPNVHVKVRGSCVSAQGVVQNVQVQPEYAGISVRGRQKHGRKLEACLTERTDASGLSRMWDEHAEGSLQPNGADDTMWMRWCFQKKKKPMKWKTTRKRKNLKKTLRMLTNLYQSHDRCPTHIRS
jgi:hypothetical protein